MAMLVYAGCLTLGGVLLVASVFLGRLDLDGDGTPDIDLDRGIGQHHGVAPLSANVLSAVTSIRFWTFLLAFFGLTGVVLRSLRLAGEVSAAVTAVCTGVVIASAVAYGMRRLASGPDSVARAGDYVGRSARVLVPVRRDGLGKVRLQVRGTTVDLIAVTDEDELTTRDEVLIVEMDGTRARVART